MSSRRQSMRFSRSTVTLTKETLSSFVHSTPNTRKKATSTFSSESFTNIESPEWISGSEAIFKTPKLKSITRRSTIHNETRKGNDMGFKIPSEMFSSPPGVKTRSRRSSIYVSSQSKKTNLDITQDMKTMPVKRAGKKSAKQSKTLIAASKVILSDFNSVSNEEEKNESQKRKVTRLRSQVAKTGKGKKIESSPPINDNEFVDSSKHTPLKESNPRARNNSKRRETKTISEVTASRKKVTTLKSSGDENVEKKSPSSKISSPNLGERRMRERETRPMIDAKPSEISEEPIIRKSMADTSRRASRSSGSKSFEKRQLSPEQKRKTPTPRPKKSPKKRKVKSPKVSPSTPVKLSNSSKNSRRLSSLSISKKTKSPKTTEESSIEAQEKVLISKVSKKRDSSKRNSRKVVNPQSSKEKIAVSAHDVSIDSPKKLRSRSSRKSSPRVSENTHAIKQELKVSVATSKTTISTPKASVASANRKRRMNTSPSGGKLSTSQAIEISTSSTTPKRKQADSKKSVNLREKQNNSTAIMEKTLTPAGNFPSLQALQSRERGSESMGRTSVRKPEKRSPSKSPVNKKIETPRTQDQGGISGASSQKRQKFEWSTDQISRKSLRTPNRKEEIRIISSQERNASSLITAAKNTSVAKSSYVNKTAHNSSGGTVTRNVTSSSDSEKRLNLFDNRSASSCVSTSTSFFKDTDKEIRRSARYISATTDLYDTNKRESRNTTYGSERDQKNSRLTEKTTNNTPILISPISSRQTLSSSKIIKQSYVALGNRSSSIDLRQNDINKETSNNEDVTKCAQSLSLSSWKNKRFDTEVEEIDSLINTMFQSPSIQTSAETKTDPFSSSLTFSKSSSGRLDECTRDMEVEVTESRVAQLAGRKMLYSSCNITPSTAAPKARKILGVYNSPLTSTDAYQSYSSTCRTASSSLLSGKPGACDKYKTQMLTKDEAEKKRDEEEGDEEELGDDEYDENETEGDEQFENDDVQSTDKVMSIRSQMLTEVENEDDMNGSYSDTDENDVDDINISVSHSTHSQNCIIL